MDGKELKECQESRQDIANTIEKSFITVIFCLPELNPVDSQTLNYTPVAVGIIFVAALGSWVLWARRWFTGPAGHMMEEVGVLGDMAREQAQEVVDVTEERAEGKR